jgi:hypothetical protein
MKFVLDIDIPAVTINNTFTKISKGAICRLIESGEVSSIVSFGDDIKPIEIYNKFLKRIKND